ncbi:MAG TPA: hypothetical protein P5235_08755 [Saprospiraceae bacterium]|nr:hypothetical protein [Saprospiraceae bacterium]MCB9328263.1 hypothetical protein [Lewinellaceae bacterium]HRX29464.1 hypothetical protein [Saprospiraceae bacterium]
MLRAIVINLFLILGTTVFGQFGTVSLGGASYVSLAGSGSAIGGVESIYTNQAGIIKVKNFGIDANIENRFGLEATSAIGISLVKNTKMGHWGLTLQRFGLKEYSQSKAGVCYAMSLFSNLHLAAQLNYYNLNIENYGKTNLYNFETGMLFEINGQFDLGIHVLSPISKKISESSQIQTQFTVGVAYKPDYKVTVLADFSKPVDFDPEIKVGLSYLASSLFEARMGYNITIGNFGFGVGLRLNKVKARAAFSINNVLGNTPALSFQYNN